MHYKEVKTILSPQNGMNLYRGCTHGCIYCDGRSTCYQNPVPFEDIEVKSNAVELLEQALRHKRKRCMIGTGGMSDPYLHAEEGLRHTRQCLELIERYGFGVTLHTKSDRILRDLDLIKAINGKTKAVVQMTMTTFDEDLCRIVEPGVCTTLRRFEVLKILRENGIPTVVWLTPILPHINDSEDNLRGLLSYCKDAGVWGIITFGMGLTLREGDREYFYGKLEKHFPGMRDRYITEYGNAYELPCRDSSYLMGILRHECKAYGIEARADKVFEYLHRFEEKDCGEQMSLF